MYIERAQDRTIKGVYTAPQKGYAEEEIADDDPAVLAFLARQSPAPRDLAAEIDALKAEVARAKAAEAVLIEKSIVSKGEIDAKVPDVGIIAVDVK